MLFALSSAVTAVAAPASSTVKKPAAHKAAPKAQKSKAVRKPPVKKVEAPKPEVLSPFSLDGQVFKRSRGGDRLTDDDAARYAHVFAFQDVGNFRKANEEIKKLKDHRLMGHVLFQRFTGRDYKATYKELADWMKLYSDHPGAQKIYALAQNRHSQKGAPSLTGPRISKGVTGYHDYDTGQLAQPYMADQEYSLRERDIMADISRNLSENPSRALNRLEGAGSVFNPTKYDALRAQIAESYFYNGNVGQAYKLATASSSRSGKDIPLAGWIAGLSAWKLGKYSEAAEHFERVADSPRASAWMAAGGAHWAARSYLRNHQPQKVSLWLRKAAEHPRSFYGIISAKALGMEQSRFTWEIPELGSGLVEILAEIPSGRRALALMDARRPILAEQELRQINPGDDGTLQEAMMALAHESGAPAFEMRLGSGLKNRSGGLYDAALYPDAPWQPEGGYHVDKALVHAFIRQESKFDAVASNKSSGAMGIMQLMPSTAMLMARKYNIKVDKDRLQEPAVNIRLGQKYLADMLQEGSVQNNLFKLAVAYNAGPGKLSRWEREVHYGNDPLLFIESIPVSETRIFVERVLTNYWIYRIKYGQNTDSLENVAAGEWPLYAK
ncbi:MAG: lytic transglycosylase domain-containing protein [Alphaproteobacteria bacterium]|nr:lytic transglycosylase domain-containing protein [Alphaproteobacteria bacterium]